MAEAVLIKEWDQTSVLLSTLANIHRNEKERPQPFVPTDFHPLRQEKDGDDREKTIKKIREKQRRAKLKAQHGRKGNQGR